MGEAEQRQLELIKVMTRRPEIQPIATNCKKTEYANSEIIMIFKIPPQQLEGETEAPTGKLFL